MAGYTRRSRINQVGYVLADKNGERPDGSASVTIVYMEADNVSMDNNQAEYTPGGMVAGEAEGSVPELAGQFTTVSFGRPLRSHDPAAAGIAELPGWGPLARACGFTEAILNAGGTGSSYSYVLGDTHLTSAAVAGDVQPIANIWVNTDRYKTSANNVVGNLVFNFTAGMVPTYEFTGRGQFNNAANVLTYPVEGVMTAMTDYDNAGVPCQDMNCTLTAVAGAGGAVGTSGPPPISSIVIDCGNVIDERRNITGPGGYAIPQITARNPTCTIVVEEADFAEVNWDDVYKNETPTVVVTIDHDNNEVDSRELNIIFNGTLQSKPPLTELNGKLVRTLDLALAPGATFSMIYKSTA